MTKQKLIYILSFIGLVAGGTTACKGDKVISRDKMVEILRDIQLAEAVYQVKSADYREKKDKDALVKGVLTKHGITQAELDSSLVWYSDNVEMYNRVNDSIITQLNRESTKANKDLDRYNSLSHRSSATLPNHYFLTEATPTLSFEIDSMRVRYYPDFKVEFKSMWLEADTDAEFRIRFAYADTILSESRKLVMSDSSSHTIAKPLLPGNAGILKNISGYVHFNNGKMSNQKILLYDIVLTDSIRTVKTDTISKSKINDGVEEIIDSTLENETVENIDTIWVYAKIGAKC